MTQYRKLCRYIFDWVKKPLAGVCAAMLACDVILVAVLAEGSAAYAEVLDSLPVMLVSGGALVLFAGLTRQRLHRLWGKHRGIYTMIALPAPGWAFPAAAYTVSAAGTLALVSLQIAALAALYPMFWVFSGVGEGLYYAFLRSATMGLLLPRTFLQLEMAAGSLWCCIVFPFAFMGDFAKPRLRNWNDPDEARSGMIFIVIWAISMFLRDSYRALAGGIWLLAMAWATVSTLRGWSRGTGDTPVKE